MKALSLTEPWATLVARGFKRCETRSWDTSYRGPLAIHAARKLPEEFTTICRHGAIGAALGELLGEDPLGLRFIAALHCHMLETRGKVLAVSCLLDSFPTHEAAADPDLERGMWFADGPRLHVSPEEREFGDYSPGRRAWLLRGPLLLPKAIPGRGMLNLWEFDEALLPEEYRP